MDKELQLTKNFTLRELVEGMMPEVAIKWNWEDITDAHVVELTKIAQVLQKIRDEVNANFKRKDGKEIRMKLSCGYRCLRWEKSRGRTGGGMHDDAKAVDFFPDNCEDDAQYVTIFNWIMQKYSKWDGGLAAKSYVMSLKTKRLVSKGFIHIDNGRKRRWKY